MRRLFSRLSLNVAASIIALGIFALSLNMLWETRRDTWREAEQASRNLLTTITRDIGGSIRLYDLFLQDVIEGLSTEGFGDLPPHVQHRILFDQAAASGDMRPILLLDTEGDIVRDASSLTPRSGNFADRDYFIVHKQRADADLYVSKPYRNRLREGEWSISISRRVSGPDGHFAGVVSTALPLSRLNDALAKIRIGSKGSITLLRSDGILLTRQPHDERDVGRDFSASPNVSRVMREQSGQFIGTSMIDNVSRHFVFAHIEGLPLIVQVAMSVDEIYARWWKRAIVLSFLTLVLCAAVVTLTFMFQRELRRRTLAETELEMLASTDSLTALPNRRAFDALLAREWSHAIRAKTCLSMLFIDADSFKSYNDHYGHSEGDTLLRAIAEVLRAQLLRPRDYAARYGGEEFTVLLPETDLRGAAAVAERIRLAVSALAIEHKGSHHRILTISIGVGTAAPTHGEVASSLIKASDKALYEAKAAGRNLVRPKVHKTHDGPIEGSTHPVRGSDPSNLSRSDIP